MKRPQSQKDIIKSTAIFVKKNIENDPAHDWWHTFRVWKLATEIAKSENADIFVVQMAALLHDTEDWKSQKVKQSITIIRGWLQHCRLGKSEIDKICVIVENISFKGSSVGTSINSLEAKVVQDADRLDAIGAIGISRAFTYGGKVNRFIFDPGKPLRQLVSDLRKRDSYSSLHHFYDKLLLLKGLMNTRTGKMLAKSRHNFLILFLKQFSLEWKRKI